MAVLDSCQFFVTLVLILFSSFSVTNGRSIIDEDATINTNEHGDHLISQPYFENFYQRNVTITEGQSAYLHCRVKNLGNKTVAWVRVRDVHLLTLDNVTYTSDWRFRSIHDDDTDDWTLKIGFTKLRDSGIYLCQVNAEPWITQDFKLNVVEEEPSKTYGYTINGRSSSDTTATTLPSSSVKDSSNIPTTSTPRDDALIPPPLVIQ